MYQKINYAIRKNSNETYLEYAKNIENAMEKFELKENIITAFGNIEEGDRAKFISIFLELERKYASVIIKLHTFGGGRYLMET